MKKLRLGIIGCGGICRTAHVPAYEQMDNVEIVAMCDIIVSRAEKLGEIFGAEAYEDYHEVLKRDDIDAIDICTPNYLHSEIAIAALEAGKHVFCEKPDAVSVEKVLEMKAASEKAGKTLMIMRNNRFLPSSRFMKKYIEDGKTGMLYAGRCGWKRRRGIPGKGGWFTTKEQSGGGPLIDLGVHMIDLAIWLMGNPTPVAVSGSTFCKFADAETEADSLHAQFGDAKEDGVFDVEDLAMGFIKFDNGACLQIEFSWASNIEIEHNFVEISGEKAGFRWLNGELSIFGEEYGRLVDIAPKFDGEESGHANNLKHFVDVVLNGAAPNFVPQQGVNMIKILRAIYESAETGKEVVL